jgi:GR25 family glycosyltransferase involved in LPS biosynthesis
MKLTKKLVQIILYIVLVFLLILFIVIVRRRTQKKIPIIHDVHIVNLDKSKDRWSNLQPELKKLYPLPCIRWSATDGRKLSEEQMVQEGIPPNMLPSDTSVKEEHKQGRKGEIGCYLSHKRLLEHLNTLDVHPDAGHLILEDDVVIDDDFLEVWNENVQYIPKNWGLFYVGLRENVELGNVYHGIAELKKTWGTHGFIVKHSKIPEILKTIQPMYGPIDVILQDNYTKLNAYALVKSKIHSDGAAVSTIWHNT